MKFHTYLYTLAVLLVFSCSDDDNSPVVIDEPVYELIEGTLGKAEYFHRSLVEDNYVLVNNAQGNTAILMDKNAEPIHDFPLNGKRIGNDVFLMNNGKLLAMLESEDPKIELGGFGGILEILDRDGNIEWSFEYSSDDYILHHDAETLPNGNIIVQVWERKTSIEGQQAGFEVDTEVFPDGIIEVNPTTDEIVWEWYAWDHLIQDIDDTKDNFGVVADNPQKINVNYIPDENGDITHANGIAYDVANDLIFLSVNFFSEVWVIDHSTTTMQASSDTGGNYNKGGDLVYRFGNPLAYDNTVGERLFYNNHHPNLLKGVGSGNILIFSNGEDMNQSTVYELKLPSVFSLASATDNEPEVVWSFTDPELYAPRVSGAVRLTNGNTMIAEGDFGIWEVTPEGEVVWKFSNPGFYWRAYHYDKTSQAILNLNL